MHLREKEKLTIKEWIKQDSTITVPAVRAKVLVEFQRSIASSTIRRLLRAFGANLRTHTKLNNKERELVKEWVKENPAMTRWELSQKIQDELQKNCDISTVDALRKTLGADIRPHVTLTDTEKLTVQRWIKQNPKIDKKTLRQKIQNTLGRTVSESTVARLLRQAKLVPNLVH